MKNTNLLLFSHYLPNLDSAKMCGISSRVDKSDLGSFRVLPMELWSKNGQKHQKRNFTVILALFLKFEFHHNVRKIQPESIKLVRGHLQVFW